MIRRCALRVAAGLTAATVTMATVGLPASAMAAPAERIAACQVRACLLVLDRASDRDGDGVADVDEVRLGTDPDNPDRTPDAAQLLDVLTREGLPSFDRHLTELVVLPKQTPDGTEIATGLGGFDLVDHDAKLFPDLWKGLAGLRKNGFDPSLGFTSSLPMQELRIPKEGPLFGPAAEMALVSAGSGVCCATNAGANAGKDVSGVSGGAASADGGHKPEYTYGADGSANRQYTVNYTDGSHDDVQQTQDSKGAVSSVTSFDGNGEQTSYTYTSISSSIGDDGTKTTVAEQTKTTYSNGESTGSTKTTTTTTTGNGASTTTTTTDRYDGDGKLIGHEQTTTTSSDCTGKVTCGTDEKYQDPDYVATSALSDEDMSWVLFRLNAVRTPGPDTGGQREDADPSQWHQGDPTPLPWVSLVDSDGVVAFAAGHTPVFNHVQPDYDPRLAELGQLSGQGVPTSDGDTTRWP